MHKTQLKRILILAIIIANISLLLAGIIQKNPSPQQSGFFTLDNNIRHSAEARLINSNKSVLIIPAENTEPRYYTVLTSILATNGYSSIIFRKPANSTELDYWIFAKQAYDLVVKQSKQTEARSEAAGSSETTGRGQVEEDEVFVGIISLGEDGKTALASILEKDYKPDAIITSDKAFSSEDVKTHYIKDKVFLGLSPKTAKEITKIFSSELSKELNFSYLYIIFLFISFITFAAAVILVLFYFKDLTNKKEVFPKINRDSLNIIWLVFASIIACLIPILLNLSSFTNMLIFITILFVLIFPLNLFLDKKNEDRNVIMFQRNSIENNYSVISSLAASFFIILFLRISFTRVPSLNKEIISILALAPLFTCILYAVKRQILNYSAISKIILLALPYIALFIVFSLNKNLELAILSASIIFVFYTNHLAQNSLDFMANLLNSLFMFFLILQL